MQELIFFVHQAIMRVFASENPTSGVIRIRILNSLIASSLLYVSEESNEIPQIKHEYVKPERSILEPGTPILILDGALAGFKGDFLTFENSFQDRLIIRYFSQDSEQITIQNIADIDWN